MTQQQKIGIGIALVMVVGGFIYLVSSIRRGPGIGAEREIAPNRKPYLNDDQLEGPKLDKSLTWAMVTLGILAVGLPAYWLREPHRQEGKGFDRGTSWFHEESVKDGMRLSSSTERTAKSCSTRTARDATRRVFPTVSRAWRAAAARSDTAWSTARSCDASRVSRRTSTGSPARRSSASPTGSAASATA